MKPEKILNSDDYFYCQRLHGRWSKAACVKWQEEAHVALTWEWSSSNGPPPGMASRRMLSCANCMQGKKIDREYRAKNREKNLARQKPAISNQIIPISPRKISKETVNTVNARELHEFLEPKQEYAAWIKNRIKKYGFVENEDFLIILSKSTGGRPSKEYHLTLDMAKELSMVERTEKGRQARRYFIECERIAKEKVQQRRLPEPVPVEAGQNISDLYWRLEEMRIAAETIRQAVWQAAENVHVINRSRAKPAIV